MPALEPLVVFVGSLLIGGLGVYVGSRVFTHMDSYGRALVTALLGAVVWSAIAFFVGWIPLLGPLLALLGYLAVVNWQYPGGWGTAAGIALIAWLTSLALLSVLATLNVITFGAVGVPAV